MGAAAVQITDSGLIIYGEVVCGGMVKLLLFQVGIVMEDFVYSVTE